MANIVTKVYRANQVLQSLCVLGNLEKIFENISYDFLLGLVNLIETVLRVSSYEDREVQVLDRLGVFLNFVKVVLRLSDVIDRTSQQL